MDSSASRTPVSNGEYWDLPDSQIHVIWPMARFSSVVRTLVVAWHASALSSRILLRRPSDTTSMG